MMEFTSASLERQNDDEGNNESAGSAETAPNGRLLRPGKSKS